MNAVLDASYFTLSLDLYVQTASLPSVLILAHVLTSPTQIHMLYIFSLSTVDMHTQSIERIHLTSIPMPRRWKSGTADITSDTHSHTQCTNFKTHIQASNSVRVFESLVTFLRAAKEQALNVYSVCVCVCVALSKWQIWTARYSKCYTGFKRIKRKKKGREGEGIERGKRVFGESRIHEI